MKITAQLALSQIKLNKKRTFASIFAIALSTALVTAVMCFATSGNQMLTDFLGPGYGDYAGAYSVIIAGPALLFGVLIAAMSVTVISNIFVASANKRIQEFGILKCVGGTKKQIKASVLYESLWLCLVGIPLGLIFGTLIGYIGVRITGHFVADINELSRSIIMRPFSFSLSFHVSVWTYLFAAVFSLVIVLVSAHKPAKAVGKLTAIQCVKGMEANSDLKDIEVKDGLAEKILGCEGAIAYRNIKRNQQGYKATIRALSLGILLLLLTGGLSGQAKDFKDWMNPNSREMMVDYCSIRDIGLNRNTGKEEEKIVAPITAVTYHEITERLSAYGTTVYGVGSDACTYHALPDRDVFSEEMLQVSDLFDENGETRVELLAVDETLYKELCDRAGAAYGSNLLINTYEYNDHGRMKTITPFNEEVTEITLITAADEKQTLPVGGILHQDDLKERGFQVINPYPVRMVVPDIDARFFDWYCAPDDEQTYTEYARKIMDAYYPILTEDSYVEQGYTVRIARVDTMVKMLNVAIVLVQMILYGFVILLILMGFSSVVSTLANNIRIRSREFAILKSVGMTNASLRKMVYCESILCMIKAFLPGITLGIAIPFGINLAIRKVFPVLYHIPWGIFLVGMAVLSAVVMMITCVEFNQLKDKSIIDEIRMDVM
ncbi:MAG: ABC transporter permease [bacterium]|nr:ABC transporter permease [bacterium]MDY4098444.1 ABC transporter permease [Lachnospiraceae bacterium]